MRRVAKHVSVYNLSLVSENEQSRGRYPIRTAFLQEDSGRRYWILHHARSYKKQLLLVIFWMKLLHNSISRTQTGLLRQPIHSTRALSYLLRYEKVNVELGKSELFMPSNGCKAWRGVLHASKYYLAIDV